MAKPELITCEMCGGLVRQDVAQVHLWFYKNQDLTKYHSPHRIACLKCDKKYQEGLKMDSSMSDICMCCDKPREEHHVFIKRPKGCVCPLWDLEIPTKGNKVNPVCDAFRKTANEAFCDGRAYDCGHIEKCHVNSKTDL